MNNPLPIILPLGSNEILLNDWIQYLDYIFGVTSIPLLAVTFTLIPAEWAELKKHSAEEQSDYLFKKISKYYSNFIFVTELTKKGVPHLHGIVLNTPLKEDIFTQYKKWKNKKTELHYEDTRYSNQNYIKKIYTKRQLSAWINYMRKSMQPVEILEYFYHNLL